MWEIEDHDIVWHHLSPSPRPECLQHPTLRIEIQVGVDSCSDNHLVDHHPVARQKRGYHRLCRRYELVKEEYPRHQPSRIQDDYGGAQHVYLFKNLHLVL